MIAVDASVAVKWLLPEPAHVEARLLLKNENRLVAPSILRVEVAGAIIRNYRKNVITEAEAMSALAHWSRILQSGAVQLVPVDDLYDLAIAVAFLSRHALADCFYVAAGKDMDICVITADVKLHERCTGVYDKIQLLVANPPH